MRLPRQRISRGELAQAEAYWMNREHSATRRAYVNTKVADREALAAAHGPALHNSGKARGIWKTGLCRAKGKPA